MRWIRIGLVAALVIMMGTAMTGCRSAVCYKRTVEVGHEARHGGPPPHAPAHGYRHRHRDGVELVYNTNIGVYVVVGHDGHYFSGDTYYRYAGGLWYTGRRIDGKWKKVPVKHIPPGLQKKHVCKKGK